MKLIAAVDNNWAIGYNGQLLVSIPADHRNFRQETTGNVVIYGRKTLATFPFEKPLSGRRNIILTSKRNFEVEGAEVAHSIEEALKLVEGVDTDKVYVIGGASIYEQMVDMCDTAIITKVDYSYQADAFIKNLDKAPEWELEWESDEQTCYDIEYVFCRYKKKQEK